MKNLADFLLAPPNFRGTLGKLIVFLEFHPIYETLDSILHKGADGHRTDASGDRSDDGCLSCHIVEIDIFVVGIQSGGFFVNANMVRIPEPLVVVFLVI